MGKKATRIPDVDAPAVGYLRMSNLHFPETCLLPAERAAHVDNLRSVRMAELRAEAARHGDEITVWYDDMGVSARGEFLEKRTEFERARLDARSGRVRVLYSRDLSRLFRDLVQQELWFAEMENLGVTVRVQDLPYLADEATRTLVRQQLGAINEYMAARQGAIIRAVMVEKVKQGQWVGRMLSQWGLCYDAATKGFVYDPETADKIRLVFEVFVASGGVASKAARELNRQVRDGDPRATRTPWNVEWQGDLLLFQVRCPLYRRRIVYGDIILDVPDRIPEVVPVALVAEADRLLAARQAVYDLTSNARRAIRPPTTYLGLIRCAACGQRMRALKSRDAECHADGRWTSWRCSNGSAKGGCRVSFCVRQTRLDALIGQGLAAAFAAYGDCQRNQKPVRLGQPSVRTNPVLAEATLTKGQEHLKRRRDRYLDLYARGILTDLNVLKRHLTELDQEEAYLKARVEEVAVLTGPVPDASGSKELARLITRFEQAWEAPPQPVHDPARRAFLLEEKITVRVRIESRVPPCTYNPASTRLAGGPATVLIDIPRLGLTAERAFSVTETEEAYRAARKRPDVPRAEPEENALTMPKRPRPRKAGRNVADE